MANLQSEIRDRQTPRPDRQAIPGAAVGIASNPRTAQRKITLARDFLYSWAGNDLLQAGYSECDRKLVPNTPTGGKGRGAQAFLPCPISALEFDDL